MVATGVEDGATGLVARREKGAGGQQLPTELSEAIRKHRTALIARLMGDVPVADESAPEKIRGKTLREVWGEQALEDQAKYGHRGARLYSLIDEQVLTSRGSGKLIDVKSGTARVLLDRGVSRAVAKAKREGKKKPTLATVAVPIGAVYPATAGAVGAERDRGAVADLVAERRNRMHEQYAEVGENIYFPPTEDEPASDPYASYEYEDGGDSE